MSKIRPLSPHLQVYKLPMAAVLSITHRITGVLLFIGLLVLAWVFIACAMFPEVIHKVYGFFLLLILHCIVLGCLSFFA